MIPVTRLNGRQITINALLIETVEATPDTVITLTTGNKYVVLEPVPEVVAHMREYLRGIGLIAAPSTKTEGS